MRSQPLTIMGPAGPVVLESGFLANKYSITVGGRPAIRTRRRRDALPVAGGGAVEATVRGGFLEAYPILEIEGVRYRTGPPVPLILRALALVPILLLAVGGLLGGLIGGLAVMVNMAVARLSESAVAIRVLLMLGVLVGAVVTWIVVAGAIGLAVS